MTRDAHYLLVGKDVQFIKIGQTATSGCMGDRELVSWLDDISIFVSFKYDLALVFEFLFPHIENGLFGLYHIECTSCSTFDCTTSEEVAFGSAKL